MSGLIWRKGATEFPGASGGRYRSRSSSRVPPSSTRARQYRERKWRVACLRVERTDPGLSVLDGHRCWSPSKVRASPAPVASEDVIVRLVGPKRKLIYKKKATSSVPRRTPRKKHALPPFALVHDPQCKMKC